MRSLSLAILLLAAPAALAHPLPNLRFDRAVHVRVGSAGVTVKYALEINEWTMAIDGNRVLKGEETAGLTGPLAYAKAYAARKAPLLADGLRGTLGGVPLEFRATKVEVGPDRDHLRLRFEFAAAFPDGATGGAFAFADQNFEDQAGQMALTLDASHPGVDLADVVEPADLRGKSSTEYGPGDGERSRRVAAVVTLPTPAPTAPPPAPPVGSVVEAVGERSLADDLRARGVAAIFDHDLGFGLLLALCVLFGAGHAFTPGHGKTMVAAYLVGERGTVWHAVVLGLTTTLTHTGSVIAVAGAFFLAYGDAPPALAQAWLSLAGGLLIAGVGFWLFVQRLGGRADHVHLTAAPAHVRQAGLAARDSPGHWRRHRAVLRRGPHLHPRGQPRPPRREPADAPGVQRGAGGGAGGAGGRGRVCQPRRGPALSPNGGGFGIFPWPARSSSWPWGCGSCATPGRGSPPPGRRPDPRPAPPSRRCRRPSPSPNSTPTSWRCRCASRSSTPRTRARGATTSSSAASSPTAPSVGARGCRASTSPARRPAGRSTCSRPPTGTCRGATASPTRSGSPKPSRSPPSPATTAAVPRTPPAVPWNSPCSTPTAAPSASR